LNNAQATLKQAAPKKKRKAAALDKKKAKAGWFFVAPFLIGFILIYIPIIFNSIESSFFSVKQGQLNEFVGWDNYYYALFSDTSFVTTLTSGIRQLLIDIPAIVIFSLFMAVLLNQKMIGRAAFRAILFVPVILSTGLIAEIDASNTLQDYMSETSGISTGAESTSNTSSSDIISAADVTTLFESMRIGTGLVSYITQLVNDVYDIINRSGVQILIFLAGLQSISPAVYESCSIDGATTWETFWKITFPMISPMILVNTIYTVIDSFTSTSSTVMSYILNVYDNGGAQSRVQSTAMGWIYFLIVLAIIAVVSGVLSAYIFYQRRD
jgi:ABC-type sugar transport system permease subunit